MTKKKVLSVIDRYEAQLKKVKVAKKAFSHQKFPKTRTNKLAHCYSMLDEMREFVKQNRMDKVFRWLGFIQGVFWSLNIYNLESLKNHNRRNKKIRR